MRDSMAHAAASPQGTIGRRRPCRRAAAPSGTAPALLVLVLLLAPAPADARELRAEDAPAPAPSPASAPSGRGAGGCQATELILPEAQPLMSDTARVLLRGCSQQSRQCSGLAANASTVRWCWVYMRASAACGTRSALWVAGCSALEHPAAVASPPCADPGGGGERHAGAQRRREPGQARLRSPGRRRRLCPGRVLEGGPGGGVRPAGGLRRRRQRRRR